MGIISTIMIESAMATLKTMAASRIDEPMTCSATDPLVAPRARRMRSSCARCSMLARPILISPMAATTSSNMEVAIKLREMMFNTSS